jgi:NAD-reducing hydrogenase large subunit
MNHAVRWVADNVISEKGTITEGMLNQVEVAIRAYDPCLSCATQALGHMSLKAELYDHKGSLINQIIKNGD